MAMTVAEFDRCFDQFDALMRDAYSTGRTLRPLELRMLATASHAMTAFLHSGVLDTHPEARDALADWRRFAIGLIEPNLNMSHVLTIGYDPKNIDTAREDPTHYIAISYLMAICAMEEAGTRLDKLSSMRDVFLSSCGSFLETVTRRPTDFSGHRGTMWTAAHMLRTLHAMEQDDWVTSLIQNLVEFLTKNHAGIAKIAAVDSFGGLLNESIERNNLQLATFPAGKANDAGQPYRLIHELRMGGLPTNPPPIPGYRPGVIHWCIHAWIQVLETDEVAPGRPANVQAGNRAEADFSMVWRLAGSAAVAPVSQTDLDIAAGLDDAAVRDLLRRFFQVHPSVGDAAKANLEHEATKAHGGGEIADFMVELDVLGGHIVVACPVKSGKEIKGQTADKIGLRYAYQFSRPVERLPWHQVRCYPVLLSGITLDARELVRTLNSIGEPFVFPLETYAFIRAMKSAGLWPPP